MAEAQTSLGASRTLNWWFIAAILHVHHALDQQQTPALDAILMQLFRVEFAVVTLGKNSYIQTKSKKEGINNNKI
jgi:hypothetical protein